MKPQPNRGVALVHITVDLPRSREVSITLTAKWITILWNRYDFKVYTNKNAINRRLNHNFEPGQHSFLIVADQLTTLNLNAIRCSKIYFDNCQHLKWLSCELNYLTALNARRLPALKTLLCSFNLIKELDLPLEQANLTHLACSQNNIKELNLSGYPSLRYVDCNNNRLKDLPTAGCTRLKKLTCSGNNIPTKTLATILQELPPHNDVIKRIEADKHEPRRDDNEPGIEIYITKPKFPF